MRAALVALAALLAAAPQLAAQMYGSRTATRAELEAAVDSLRRLEAAESDASRAQELSWQAMWAQLRLEEGDIRPGDVVSLTVSGEEKWTGDFTVTPRGDLELPDIDPISLDGVLYAEAEETVARALARYLREPRIRLDVLKRVAVLGHVGSPGFYNVTGSALVSDVIMLAGGPASTAKIDKVQVRRGGERVVEESRIAFQSMSLDQLGVVSGDELFVPGASGTSAWRVLVGVLGVAGSIALLVNRL